MPVKANIGGGFSSAGYQRIMNEFNEGQQTDYLDRTIWRHRCSSIIPMISDSSWFDQVDDLNCNNELIYKIEPTGIKISPMNSYNQTLKSHTPSQNTQRMNFGEWLYTQWKFSKMEINEKCDSDSFFDDIEKAYRLELDKYIEQTALLRISMINPCFNDKCVSGHVTGSKQNPIDLNVTNSHKLPLRADQLNKNICDDRGHVMIFPRCEQSVLSENEEVKDLYRGCCTTDVPSLSNSTPSFGTNTKIIYSDYVPYTKCANGDKIYKIPHFPIGSFGYASILAASEVVDSKSIENHWGEIHRMVVRFGMVIPTPWDITNYYVRIKSNPLPLALACD